VAQQLGLLPEGLSAYGSRIQTRTTHLLQVQAYLGFRPALPLDFAALTTWLVERALEHDKPTLLLQLACEKLRRDQIVRPGITRLERLVATAREQAHAETFRRLTPLLPPTQQTPPTHPFPLWEFNWTGFLARLAGSKDCFFRD
jgi:hypothetical protein